MVLHDIDAQRLRELKRLGDERPYRPGTNRRETDATGPHETYLPDLQATAYYGQRNAENHRRMVVKCQNGTDPRAVSAAILELWYLVPTDQVLDRPLPLFTLLDEHTVVADWWVKEL